MKRTLLVLFVSLGVTLFFGNSLGVWASEERHRGEVRQQKHHGESHHRHGHHEAHHGGVLNVIGEERGHIEIRLVEDTMEAWFVGGGNDTNRSVPIKAAEVALTVTVPGRGEEQLVLKADPMRLAGEKAGRCSHFVAKADWLNGIKEFEATGKVEFKGVVYELVIKYPEGYDPMHGHGAH
jgi:hypothetical protein